MFYLMIHTFYLWLFGINHMVKDHRDSQRGNPLLPLHGLLFLISSNGTFTCTVPDKKVQSMAFVTPAEEHWLE